MFFHVNDLQQTMYIDFSVSAKYWCFLTFILEQSYMKKTVEVFYIVESEDVQHLCSFLLLENHRFIEGIVRNT